MYSKAKGPMLLVSVLSVVVLMAVLAVPVEAGGKKVSPPLTNAFGRSLAEWNKLYWEWFLDPDAPPIMMEGNVLFMPIPIGEAEDKHASPVVLVGHQDVTMKVGTAFVLPVLGYAGERYVDMALPDDQYLPTEVLTQGVVKVTLDGETLIDSSVDNLKRYYYQFYFDEPIKYVEPQFRGKDKGGIKYYAEYALWVQGIGFVYPELPIGTHELELYSEYAESAFGVAYHNTWTITVTE